MNFSLLFYDFKYRSRYIYKIRIKITTIMRETSMFKSTIFFLVINFGALALGGFMQGEGPMSDWYQNLNKAPWTPPGWFFGVAWTTIMVCFSLFMAKLVQANQSAALITTFVVQFILNVAWNPVFFNLGQMTIALFLIIALTIIVGIFLFKYGKEVGSWKWLVLPYFAWLIVATSLNAYAVMYN